YYGGAIDFTVTPPGAYKEAQARLMYRRSDGDVQLRGFAQRYDFPAAIITAATVIQNNRVFMTNLPLRRQNNGKNRSCLEDKGVGYMCYN
ncbi:MAG TPA: hypothetical protein VFH88_06615, partial [Candidatus Krumholzibacteria bacterium]|nr:hypothetical protein [Candidatus Krumholzibacteria bacterium]